MSNKQEIKVKLLEEKFDQLAEDYQSISQRINRENNPSLRNALLSRLSELEVELNNIEREINKISQSRENRDEMQSLLGILTSSKLDIASFQKAYRACLPTGWINPIPEKLSDILDELETIPQSASKVKPIGLFLANLIVISELPEKVSRQVTSWAEERIDNFSELLNQIRGARNTSNPVLGTHLLVVIQPSQAYINRYFVEGWLIPDIQNYNAEIAAGCHYLTASELFDDSLKLNEVPRLLNEFICESARLCSLNNLIINFFLPLDLIDLPVDNWEIKNEFNFSYNSLGGKFKVVVRSCERLANNYPYRQLWRNKWEMLQKLTKETARNVFESGDETSVKSLLLKLRNENIVGLYLTKPLKQADKRDFFTLMLRSAIPVAFWPRNNLKTLDYQFELEKILQCQVQKLPAVIQRERLNSSIQPNEENHLGHHISLLWEDPNLLPPNINYSIQ